MSRIKGTDFRQNARATPENIERRLRVCEVLLEDALRMCALRSDMRRDLTNTALLALRSRRALNEALDQGGVGGGKKTP